MRLICWTKLVQLARIPVESAISRPSSGRGQHNGGIKQRVTQPKEQGDAMTKKNGARERSDVPVPLRRAPFLSA
jgi:hypothetical protein